jgi:PEP-CTERM motif
MRISKIVAFGALAVGASVVAAPKANAAFIAYLYQDGADVVAAGSGSIDLGGLNFLGVAGAVGSLILPLVEEYETGIGGSIAIYASISDPGSFGTGLETDATTNVGGAFGMNGAGAIGVPVGYVSGTEFTSGATWDSTTLAALGVTDGTYTWSWGTGPDADSFTLNIGEAPPTSTPEPASLALLGTGLAALGLNRRRRRKGA